jgi:hypothetical protein
MFGVITHKGSKFIYDDGVVPYVKALAGVRTKIRASHVEPSDHDSDFWMVDFSPLGGNKHYADEHGAFGTRSAALAYERQKLREFLSGMTEAIMAPSQR